MTTLADTLAAIWVIAVPILLIFWIVEHFHHKGEK